MNKKILVSTLFTVSIFFSACNENKTQAKVINENKKDEKVSLKKVENKKIVYEKNDSIINKVFKDAAKISPENKIMLIVFGTNTDPYTNKLKEDIKNSSELKKELKDELSSYYLKTHENKRLKLFHEDEYMDVDTKTLLSIYAVNATPTLIFTDKKAKAVILVPGYMPTKQFLETIKFMKSEKWKDKNRKNGEVYEALRQYYIDNGIDVRKRENKENENK